MPIFADYHRTVIGYHGTRREKALGIVSGEGSFTPSRNGDDWLGHGVYFWEYAPQQAWAWARQRYPGAEIAVLASMIRLGNCFDLVDPDNGKRLVKQYEEFIGSQRAAGRAIPKNVRARKYLDCAVLEYAYAAFEAEFAVAVDTCRGVYVPSGNEAQRRLWRGSWLCHKTHIQLCVREPRCVLGTWLVHSSDQEWRS